MKKEVSRLLVTILFCCCVVLSSSSLAPWQSIPSSSILKNEEDTFKKDLPHVCFSSTGQLLGIELMLKKLLESETTNFAIGLTFRNGVVVFSSSHSSPHLDLESEDTDSKNYDKHKDSNNDKQEKEENDKSTQQTNNQTDITQSSADTTPPFLPLVPLPKLSFHVGPRLYSATAGEPLDCQLLTDAILKLSAELWEDRDGDGGVFGIQARVPPSLLARNIADTLHRTTQTEQSGGILSAFALVFDGKSLWRVDPTGQFWKCRASAIGKHSQKVESWLVEHLPNLEADHHQDSIPLSEEEATQMLRDCIQHIFPNEKRVSGIVVLKKNNEKTQTKSIRYKEFHTVTTN